MLSWIVCLLAMAGTLYIAAIYASVEFVFLFVAELVWVIISLLLLIYQWKHLKVRLKFPLSAAELGQEVPIEVIAENGGRIPNHKMDVCLKYRSVGRKRMEKLELTLFAEINGELVFTDRIMGNESGSYHFEKAVIVLYEPLSLLRIRKRISLHERLDVMPPIYNTGVAVSERVRHFQGESDIYDLQHSGDDASELFRIREFRAGDKLKDIHWKVSAKEGEWMVRENSAPLACGVVLLVDLFAERGERRNWEALLSLAASISFALMEQECPHYAVWYKEGRQELIRIRVDSEETLYLFLTSLFEEKLSGTKRDLLELYQEQYKGETFLADICVDMKLKIWVGKEEAGSCEEARLEENLGEMLLQI